ncbi:MAG: MMPL family transporter [Ornithinimicrobium sp.]
MATFLYRLGRASFRRWPLVMAAWLVAIVGVAAVAITMSQPTNDEFTIPGIPSEEAADLQQELFPSAQDAFDQATVNVVVAAPDGEDLTQPDNKAAVDALIAELGTIDQVPADLLANPVDAGPAQSEQIVEQKTEAGMPLEAAEQDAAALSPLSDDGRVGLISFAFDVDTITDVEPATQDAVLEALDVARDGGLSAEANGQGMSSLEPPGLTAELIGIGVALIVLVLTFGSLVAAGLPILSAMVGVGLGITGITAATAFTDGIGSITPTLASMIGLAVGIDYALFILARYRAELKRTSNRAEAVGLAVGTAGSAVVFAGLTVIIALAALTVVGIPFLTAMGLAAAATVFIAVLVALTLLPAVLGLMKSKAFAGVVRRRYEPRHAPEGAALSNGVRWARLIGRGPIIAALVVVVALGALAIPVRDLYLAFPTDSTASVDTSARQASDLIGDAFGPGREAPMLAVVDARATPEAERGEAFGEVVAWASEQDGVANAQIAATNEEGSGAQVLITPEAGPDDPATQDLLTALRSTEQETEASTGATVGITGLTAVTTDVSDRLNDALPVYLGLVIGLAFILLVVVFRSIMVPLTATLGFLLSVLATLGATVLVFQEGAFGLFEGQPIVSFLPIFVIGVVFGLAMDYQVFLVTRIREARVHGANSREAIVDGFRNSARVVVAAAVIMTSVFAAFMLIDDPIITSMGFALAVAVVLDAFVIRMVLIPALLYIMGDAAWWIPGWLERLLPKVDVEGEALAPARAASAHAEAGLKEPVVAPA